MADIVDIANERVQELFEEALAKVPKPKPVRGIGVCLSPECGLPVEGERRWCNAECCATWEKYQRAR